MKRALLVVCVVACSSSKPQPITMPAAPCASTSQNEQLYAKGAELEKLGRWEEAANTYQKYVLAMGDAMTYIDRSSMELRIEQLREKSWPKSDGPKTPVKIDAAIPEPPRDGPCSQAYLEGIYEQAIACWRDDYAKTKNPLDLLYGARAYEYQHVIHPAIDLLERFLEVVEIGGDGRRAVEARIANLRRQR
jgi:tetratricopeptide (TPR) repeat protein